MLPLTRPVWQMLPETWRESVEAVIAAVIDPNDPFQPLPVAMVARRLGESRQLVHSWVKSGKLQPAAYAPDGRPLVRYADAAEVEASTRNDRRSSRRNACRSPAAAGAPA